MRVPTGKLNQRKITAVPSVPYLTNFPSVKLSHKILHPEISLLHQAKASPPKSVYELLKSLPVRPRGIYVRGSALGKCSLH